jgi:hypothetical protein
VDSGGATITAGGLLVDTGGVKVTNGGLDVLALATTVLVRQMHTHSLPIMRCPASWQSCRPPPLCSRSALGGSSVPCALEAL